ncbi:hypothetical protein [Burkholderia sp. BCC1999]|uniref:hypothetical protein n=1 Tax=Burkholderia sp. BCC1999 TaxID=2817448 RepID=UPI002AC36DDF|nr:hypothetical protein [Burkholderia sp. BCC1999]
MDLIFDDQLVGKISDAAQEGSWFMGSITLSPFGTSLVKFFAFMTDESGELSESDFDSKLLDEKNWWISDQGERKAISLPAVYIDDNSVYWRWA